MRYLFIFLLGLFASPVVSSDSPDSIESLMLAGNLARLNGDMEKANQYRDKIRQRDPNDPASYAFSLNTLVTELSWEESQTQFDQSLLADAERLIELCETDSPSASAVNNSNYYCGQAHFTLSYYHGIRGNYIRAGRHGTTAIEYLEDALEEDPDLIRAKMYLGVAYYYADNLPPFIKIFSRVLWFIPSGNSEKSLPYLDQVMASNDAFNDVARYIYATLLINGSEQEKALSLSELRILLKKYPSNSRFNLRYVSILLGQERFGETLQQINDFLGNDHSKAISQLDLNLLRIWEARALLGLGQLDEAEAVQQQIELNHMVVPTWGSAWREITSAQLADLRGNAEKARQHYERVIQMGKETFVNPRLVLMAEEGLKTPYSLSN